MDPESFDESPSNGHPSTGERPVHEIRGSETPTLGRCGAKLRRTNPARYCASHPIKGRARCRLHGGLTPRGVLAGAYKGRGYTKDVPPHILERMMEGYDDPELTSLRSEMHIMDARVGELFAGMSEAGSQAAWATVLEQAAQLRYLVDRPDMVNREDQLSEVSDQLTEAMALVAGDHKAWSEIYKLFEMRRRTANVELRREESQELTLRHSQALFFFSQLLVAIHEEITDDDMKFNLANRVAKLMNRDPPKRLASVSVEVETTAE